MPPVHAANLVANSGNTAYGVDVIEYWHWPLVLLFLSYRIREQEERVGELETQLKRGEQTQQELALTNQVKRIYS